MFNKHIPVLVILLLCAGCDNYFKNDYHDNSPTSGRLKVFYDEGLRLHVRNQVYTFEAHYGNATIELTESSESDAYLALLTDSCEAIVVSRLPNENELKLFTSRQYTPKYSVVAKSGVAVITNINNAITTLDRQAMRKLLTGDGTVTDSTGATQKPAILFDKNNSSVLHYMLDSVMKEKKLASHCSVLNSSIETINYVAEHANSIAFIDFAWLSDVDDSIAKANRIKIRFVGLRKAGSDSVEFPSQSSFKLGTYPFTRSVYVVRKTGEFTLAKGFETFVAGPKGQVTFLKQGLLPARQQERMINAEEE